VTPEKPKTPETTAQTVPRDTALDASSAAGEKLIIHKKPFFISMVAALAVMTLGGLVQAQRTQELVDANQRLTTELAAVSSKVADVDQSLARINAVSETIGKHLNKDKTPATTGDDATGDDPLYEGASKDAVAAATDNGLIERLNALLVDARVAAERLESAAGTIERRQKLLAAIPSRLPVSGPISSGYGVRRSPFDHHFVKHKGLDIAAPLGTPVLASADGDVIFSGWSRAFGKTLVLAHSYGIVTKYAHNSQLYAKVGEHVSKGQLISRVGSTGRSTGPHLHYEVWINGRSVSPRRFLTEQPSYETLVAQAEKTEESARASIEPVLASLSNLSLADGNAPRQSNLEGIGGDSDAGEAGDLDLSEFKGGADAIDLASLDKAAAEAPLLTSSTPYTHLANAAFGADDAAAAGKSRAEQNRAMALALAVFALCFVGVWQVARRMA
jgi:murein DD-endopeptidase MepM/ murein hydrolase activator NlpD